MVYIKTIAYYLLVFVIILTINFALPRIAPGDPAIYLVGEDIQSMSEAERAQVLHEFKLDRPVTEQFWAYLAAQPTDIGPMPVPGCIRKSLKSISQFDGKAPFSYYICF